MMMSSEIQQTVPAQLELQPVQVELVVIEHVQRGRTEVVDLAAELAADGPAGTGHQDAAPGDHRARRRTYDVHLVTTEQRVDANAAQIRDAHIAFECGNERRQEADQQTDGVRPGGDRGDPARCQ